MLPDQFLPIGYGMSSRSVAIAAMLFAVLIYGGQFVTVRHAVINGLSPHDLVALRFIVAGSIFLPIVLRRGLADLGGLGWGRGFVLAVTGGAAMSALGNIGMTLAPASHAAAIQPGMVTMVSTAGAVLLGATRLRPPLLAALLTVSVGLALIALGAKPGADLPSPWKGQLLFACAGGIWGIFIVLCQKWQVDAISATAAVAVLSALYYLPVYALFLEPRIFGAPLVPVLLHAFNQGVLNIVVALLLWTQGARTLGPGLAACFPPLIPVAGTLLAMPFLHEFPSGWQMVGSALVVVGLFGLALVQIRGLKPLR